MEHDLVGAGIVTLIVLVLVAVAEAWARLGGGKPEHTRKLVHLGGGLACLAFPFTIDSPWVVLGMAIGMAALFAAGGRWRFLLCLHGVARKSRGTEYYPVAIFLVFLVTKGRPWLYVSSVLVLAVADAFAALIGTRWGKHRYQVENESKSLEGSFAFFVIAFLAILLPAVISGEVKGETAVLAALNIGLVVTGFEAISLEGADNLFVPLGVAVFLSKLIEQPQQAIVWQNVSFVTITVAIGVAAWSSHAFNVGGALAFSLFANAAWCLASWKWALPCLSGFALYFVLSLALPRPAEHKTGVRVRVVSAVMLPSLVVLLLANATHDWEEAYLPFVTCLAATAGMTAWSYALWRSPCEGPRRHACAALTGLIAFVVAAVIPATCFGAPPLALAACALESVLAALACDALMGARPSFEPSRLWPASKFILASLAAALAFALERGGVVPLWKL